MAQPYTVSTHCSDKSLDGLKTLTFEEFYTAGFSFDQPFYLQFSDNQTLIAEKVVRILPKKRMVVFGTWQGIRVAAKIFFDPKRANLHQTLDVKGVKLLQQNKIPTPALLYEGNTADKRIYVLIFKRITKAKNLEEIWQAKESIDNILPLLQNVMIEIATQHVLGLLQRDLHLRNFLVTDKVIYTLDGAQIESYPELLSKKASMDNLALLLSQLGIHSEKYQEKLFAYYAKSRGWSLKPQDYTEIFSLIKKWQDIRWKKFSKKIFRDSSYFIRHAQAGSIAIINRYFCRPELMAVIQNPEAVFTQPNTIFLKRGNSATVIKAVLDGNAYVIKRYNIKNIWHRLRRAWRPTRAVNVWRLAQKFFLYQIRTPMPVAIIENRLFGLRGTSYYISQYVEGVHAGEFFAWPFHKQATQIKMVNQINILLKSVSKLSVSHGDLKMTNILIDESEQPLLIDLDGAQEHRWLSKLKKFWQKDLKRFLANFNEQPSLRAQFEMEFQKWR